MKCNKLIYTGAGLVIATLMSSCSDVVDIPSQDLYSSNGAPVISAIYDAQDTASAPTVLQGGVLNQMIRISGTNLSHVKSITFNGLPVDVRSSVYAESGNCWVKIPRKIPETVTDTLVYETEQGVVKKYFPVSIPHLKLDGLRNEFVLKGQKVQVSGEYFDLFGFNDTTATSTATIVVNNVDSGYTKTLKTDSISEEYMGIQIPKDCPDNSLITFTWYEMGVKYTKNVPYRMSKELMYGNFDGDLGWWNDWGKGLLTDGNNAGDPKSLGYKFLRIVGTFDSWSWNSTGFGTNWRWFDASVHPENYVCKFEVNTSSSCPFVSYGVNGKNGSKNGGYMISFDGAKTRNQFDPVSDGLTNTYGAWVTISIPLSDMIVGKTLPTETAWAALELVMQPNTGDAWKVDTSFGQFRIEPKNY